VAPRATASPGRDVPLPARGERLPVGAGDGALAPPLPARGERVLTGFTDPSWEGGVELAPPSRTVRGTG